MTRPWLRTLLVASVAISVPMISATGSRGEGVPPRVPVVVELFTSEGCSDCPPADALLAELDRTQPVPEALIIPLEEHVDYWDHQGWRDPFSSAAFTERQVAYARRLGIASPYTPQMVVAGQTEFVGSASQQARAAIRTAAQAPSVEVELHVSTRTPPDGSVRAIIQVNQYPAAERESVHVLLAVTEDGLASDVSAGENAGRHMQHRAVIRKIVPAGRFDPGNSFSTNVEVKIAPGWKRENLRIVTLLEGAASGKILGATSARITP
jgi:hypothetical protein